MAGRLLRMGRALLCLLPVLSAPALAEPPAPPPLEAYGNLPGLEEFTLSPDGSKLGIVATLGGIRRVMVMDPTGNVHSQVTVGTAKLRRIQWAGNNHLSIVTSSTQNLGPGFTTSRIEAYGAIILPAAGGNPNWVFDKNPSLVNAIFGEYGIRLVGGNWLAHYGAVEFVRSSSGDSESVHGRPALYSWDIVRGKARRVARSAAEDHWKSWRIDEKGEVAASLDVSYASGRWEIANGAGKTIATGVDPTGDIGLVALGKDGTSVIYSLEDDAAGEVNWFEVPLAGGEPSEVFGDADIERIYVDPMNGRILGYLPKDTFAKPVLFDPAKQTILRRVYRAFPKLDVSVLDWTPDLRYFVVRTRGNGDSGTFYLVDIESRKADPVGYERPQITDAQVDTISIVAYRAADGLEMDGILTLPPGREAKALPVVVFPHGGPHSHDEATFDWWAQAMASRGYAVFQPNFRGSTNRDDAFRRAGYGEWGRKMQSDLSDGLAELARQGIVDPKRACIVGASFGGYAALAGVTLQQGLYRCAVAVAPVSDVKMMFNTDMTESGDNPMTRRSLRESLGDPKGFDAISPRRFASRADAPVLMIHGKDDLVVPFRQSQVMADALRAAGKPHELITLREEDHWLSRGPTRLQMLQETMRFLKQHNPAD